MKWRDSGSANFVFNFVYFGKTRFSEPVDVDFNLDNNKNRSYLI